MGTPLSCERLSCITPASVAGALSPSGRPGENFLRTGVRKWCCLGTLRTDKTWSAELDHGLSIQSVRFRGNSSARQRMPSRANLRTTEFYRLLPPLEEVRLSSQSFPSTPLLGGKRVGSRISGPKAVSKVDSLPTANRWWPLTSFDGEDVTNHPHRSPPNFVPVTSQRTLSGGLFTTRHFNDERLYSPLFDNASLKLSEF